jgi:hypothetical protein
MRAHAEGVHRPTHTIDGSSRRSYDMPRIPHCCIRTRWSSRVRRRDRRHHNRRRKTWCGCVDVRCSLVRTGVKGTDHRGTSKRAGSKTVVLV